MSSTKWRNIRKMMEGMPRFNQIWCNEPTLKQVVKNLGLAPLDDNRDNSLLGISIIIKDMPEGVFLLIEHKREIEMPYVFGIYNLDMEVSDGLSRSR